MHHLASELLTTVVADFRSADIAAGGQGAPLAPIYHHALAVRNHKIPAVVINCGGISNLSVITSEAETDLTGYDAGPGNGLIDRFVRQRTAGKEHMDKDGQYGLRGSVNLDVLKSLHEKSLKKNGRQYLSLPVPKSLDIGDMELIPELDALTIEDGCATLEAFTADAIVESLNLLTTAIPRTWILTGGGWKNPVIRAELEQRLEVKLNGRVEILTADQAGWNSQAMEAQLFAYLAVRSQQNKMLTFPGTTGVQEPLTGGSISLPAVLPQPCRVTY